MYLIIGPNPVLVILSCNDICLSDQENACRRFSLKKLKQIQIINESLKIKKSFLRKYSRFFRIFINAVKIIVFRCIQDSEMIGHAHALHARQNKQTFVSENEKRRKKRKVCVKEICKILEIIICKQSVKSLWVYITSMYKTSAMGKK